MCIACDFGKVMQRQCPNCGGFLAIGADARVCAGCAILDACAWPQHPGPSDCWRWCGAMRGAYGIMRVDRTRVRSSNRVAFATWVAPVQSQWDVRRRPICRDTACMNPAHLYVANGNDRIGIFVPPYRVEPDQPRYRAGGSRVWGEADAVQVPAAFSAAQINRAARDSVARVA